MSWSSKDIVDQRTEFVLKSLERNVVFQELCNEYGISRKTGYKWRQRFVEEGLAGMHDRSRRPIESPNQLSEGIVCELIKLKLRHLSWGPKKVKALYERVHGESPSESSVKRVLDKAGLVKRRKRRRSPLGSGRLQSPQASESPNDVWTVDFKGWWLTSGRERCEPLTIRDDFSRYVLRVEAMTSTKTTPVQQVFEEVFERYGLPKAIRSDNGTPFASSNGPLGLSRLSAWWVALGIDLDRIEPGHPEQNGGHERMHLDIRKELQRHIGGGIPEHQAAFDIWRKTFNEVRPHEALSMKTPAEIYRKSERPYEDCSRDLEYPANLLPRKINPRGAIKLSGVSYFISQALGGWTVGMEPLGNECYAVWFDRLRLAEIDAKTQSVIWTEKEAVS